MTERPQTGLMVGKDGARRMQQWPHWRDERQMLPLSANQSNLSEPKREEAATAAANLIKLIEWH